MNKKRIPDIYYLYLHSKIWEKANGGSISYRDLKKYLFEWKLPKKIRPLIIRELVILGFLEKVNKRIINVKRPEFKEEKINEYYDKLNIF